MHLLLRTKSVISEKQTTPSTQDIVTFAVNLCLPLFHTSAVNVIKHNDVLHMKDEHLDRTTAQEPTVPGTFLTSSWESSSKFLEMCVKQAGDMCGRDVMAAVVLRLFIIFHRLSHRLEVSLHFSLCKRSHMSRDLVISPLLVASLHLLPFQSKAHRD